MGVRDSLGSEPQRPTPEVHEMTNADQNTRWVFRAPPGWPPVPPGWIPPAGWIPDPTWPPAPPDWRFWEPEDVRLTQPPRARERSATIWTAQVPAPIQPPAAPLSGTKRRLKKRFDDRVAPLLEPGEQRIAGVWAKSGPSPWLIVGLFGFLAGQHWYFVQVTDRRVLFVRDVRNPAKRLAWADPRESAQVHGAQWNRLWSEFHYRRPTGKDIRLNMQTIWRDDAKAVVGAIPAEPADVKPTEPPSARERSATMRKKILLGGLILLTLLAVLGAIGMVGVRSDTINPKDAAIATAQHEQAVANDRLAVANDRLTTAQQTAARAKADEAAAAAGQTTTADMNPMVKPGLAAAWNNTTTENQSSVCAALKTNPDDVAQAAANGVPAQDKGIVTVKQVLEFYQNACLNITTP